VPDRDSGSGPRPDANRRKEVLEAFPLDGLNMVGTIGSGDLIGLVLAPDRVTYRVRPGNYLGQNDGRVTAIFEDRIEMVELVPDGAGGWLERQAKIALEDN
jgi:type IV pilus assembly protein PilP